MAIGREISIPRLRAREIISGLKIQNPSEIDIEDIAWVHGILVREDSLEGADGRLVLLAERGIITVKATIPEEGRKRFIIAHELGHFEIHKHLSLCTDTDMTYWSNIRFEETDANDFAAEILMPDTFFARRCDDSDPSLDLIENLANEFQVTLTAAALRYIEFCPERCALIISEDKKIKWFKRTADFGHWFERGTKLDPDSYAYDFFRGGDIPSKTQTVPASAWVSDRRLGNSQIKEHSKALPRYNAVLTLLWIDK
jgi:Zn-dependent peptidase ImmA (M78 family)